ncbi:hypothetical protein evm_000251 [Chilo suppressalis]|nr:hypothetical protein evm_000251 [Chilo suppressalis]
MLGLRVLLYCALVSWSAAQLQEVFAWKQVTFDIDGVLVNQDRVEPVRGRGRRQVDPDDVWHWGAQPTEAPGGTNQNNGTTPTRVPPASATDNNGNGDENSFFIQYNNVPMGMERVGRRVFVSLPRRRYGIPSTLNYIDYRGGPLPRSPPLKPYPNIRDAQDLTSVYRTRADQCGRLWMVDTGRLELRGTQRQLKTPAIVIYDLSTDRQILRYEFKSTDLPAENTPTGLASITVDITNNDCANAYAYVPDLTTFGLIVYSLRENDSWRHQHNYFSFNPVAGNLFIADQSFQWSDGVFSVTLVPGSGGCKNAFFHSLIGTDEFSVSTCVLKNRTAMNDPNYFSMYSVVGNRGERSQTTMHDYHPATGVIFYAEIGRDSLACWNTAQALRSTNVAILARDTRLLSYPSDLHVTGDEVWVMANTLPRFGYSRFDTNEYNFYIYKARVQDIVAGTVCGESMQNSVWST